MTGQRVVISLQFTFSFSYDWYTIKLFIAAASDNNLPLSNNVCLNELRTQLIYFAKLGWKMKVTYSSA
jgi:hypothetical protein